MLYKNAEDYLLPYEFLPIYSETDSLDPGVALFNTLGSFLLTQISRGPKSFKSTSASLQNSL